MMRETRRPTYGLRGKQIGWEIAIECLDSHGWLPVTPSDCPWYREDGQPHACVTGLGDDVCEGMVSHGVGTVLCARGMGLGADA
jgi:hypothetical protein